MTILTETVESTPVLAMEDRRCAAINANDADALEALLTDDFVYIHGNGFAEGKAAYVDRMRSGDVRYQRLETRDVRARRHGGCVILDGAVEFGYARSDGVSGVMRALFMATWVETAAGWRLAGYASTPLPA
jgi:ketosteroid isomerase-like protein